MAQTTSGTDIVHRLPVGAPDGAYMAQFRQAMSAIQGIKDKRGFNYIAGFHGYPGFYCWHHQVEWKRSKGYRLFLPWHRAYLYHLEQLLQDQVANVALPWWDWTQVRQIPDAYGQEMVDGAHNPLFNFDIDAPNANPPKEGPTVRDPGAIGSLATKEQIDELLAQPDWGTFSDTLQDYHDSVHAWAGGDMDDLSWAGYDPIFYAHHANIDRIWYLWQIKHGLSKGITDELLDEQLQPFGMTFRQVLDIESLGYEYASSVTTIDISGGK